MRLAEPTQVGRQQNALHRKLLESVVASIRDIECSQLGVAGNAGDTDDAANATGDTTETGMACVTKGGEAKPAYS